jgi:predicted nucleotidyltransferase
METIRYKDAIIKIIEIFLPEAKIFLFGSYVHGTNKIGSDIDIAIDAGRFLTFVEHNNIIRLCDALDMSERVDIVDMHSIPEQMRKDILQKGIVWKP